MTYNDLVIPDSISTLIDTMRYSGTVSNISAKQSNGTYIITATDFTNIAVGDFVIIGVANDLKVTAKATSTFTVLPVTSTSISGTTWTHAKPYYMYGHPLEIANTLMEKDGSGVYKWQKYPVIALYLDMPEQRGGSKDTPYVGCTLYMVLATETKQTYKASQRQTNSFKATLYPLYNRLIAAFESNRKLFLIGETEDFEHEKTDKYLHNSDGANQNSLNAFVDAIEIKNLKVKIRLVPSCYNTQLK